MSGSDTLQEISIRFIRIRDFCGTVNRASYYCAIMLYSLYTAME